MNTAPLFDPSRHEPLHAPAWSDAAARSAIERLLRRTHDGFVPGRGWRLHPLDDPPAPETFDDSLYWGAGGVLWALDELAQRGANERPPSDAQWALLDGIVERNRHALGGGSEGTASYLCGEVGLRLLRWRRTGEGGELDAIDAALQANLHHPAREPLWGASGTVLAAIFLAESTGEPRWAAHVNAVAHELLATMEPLDLDDGRALWTWRQFLYGQHVHYLGAGHGFVGNVYPVLRGRAFVDAEVVDEIQRRAYDTLAATALRDDAGRVNWHAFTDRELLQRHPDRRPLVQDCHGAPGVICRLADHVPRNAAWDTLLDAAGELVWHAGPLAKGASLCHGTAGNGMALLKLHARTGDERWLDRARAFAMHAIGQAEAHAAQFGAGRHSLWTGDLGVACFLAGCASGDPGFPTLDGLPSAQAAPRAASGTMAGPR